MALVTNFMAQADQAAEIHRAQLIEDFYHRAAQPGTPFIMIVGQLVVHSPGECPDSENCLFNRIVETGGLADFLVEWSSWVGPVIVREL